MTKQLKEQIADLEQQVAMLAVEHQAIRDAYTDQINQNIELRKIITLLRAQQNGQPMETENA